MEAPAFMPGEDVTLDVIGLPADSSSDHKSFTDYGYSGSNLVEESLNPTYHTSEDLINYINFSYLAKVTRLALALTATMASIRPHVTSEDLDISIQGSYFAHPSCLSVIIENKQYPYDSANVSITIQLKHVFRDSYVLSLKEYYKKPCIWNFTKEIKQQWRFDIGPRMFTKGLFQINVLLSPG